MAQRIQPDELHPVIQVPEEVDVAPFILSASLLVDDIEAADSTIPASRLALIETWLAAHFLHVRAPQPTSVSLDGVSIQLGGRGGGLEALTATEFGRAAMMLDPTGILKQAANAAVGSQKYQFGAQSNAPVL